MEQAPILGHLVLFLKGSLRKEKSQGKGKLQEKGESNIVGYWDKDEYIGTEKKSPIK